MSMKQSINERHGYAYDLGGCTERVHHDRKMRQGVCFLIPRMVTGGAERQLLYLLQGLDRTRFDPVVCTLYDGGDLEAEYLATGVRCISLGRRLRVDILPIYRLRRLLRELRIDILQTYLTPCYLFGELAALSLPTRVVRSIRGTAYRSPSLSHSVYTFMEGILLRFAPDRIVANSLAGLRYALSSGASARRSSVIYNGLSPDRLAFIRTGLRERLGLPENAAIVGTVATLSEKKDHRTLIAGAARVVREEPRAHFVIVGDGALLSDLRRLAGDLGLLQHLHFEGQQSNATEYIDMFDVAVLPSKEREGCSNFLLEAMALGRPVVATDVGGNAELVLDGRTGLLVPREDERAMADAILACINDRTMAAALGRNAVQYVRRRFSLDRMVEETQRVYEDLLRTQPS
jgi:L-malate glycosyltransferase